MNLDTYTSRFSNRRSEVHIEDGGGGGGITDTLVIINLSSLLFSAASTPFVEKKGYLYKMGGQRKTWKLRYFVLRPGVFQYFKDTRLTKAIGEVKLKKVSVFFPGIGEWRVLSMQWNKPLHNL